MSSTGGTQANDDTVHDKRQDLDLAVATKARAHCLRLFPPLRRRQSAWYWSEVFDVVFDSVFAPRSTPRSWLFDGCALPRALSVIQAIAGPKDILELYFLYAVVTAELVVGGLLELLAEGDRRAGHSEGPASSAADTW